ncbi:MAG TPA: serine hydrolase [Oscillospiraceae bacterium]|nr:serine hydrolase [Oscillospiraceae bacterium]HPF56764.1 serine hydrolase [Clostridiales bacterium]HPK35596.1 serine hydrolase [Oscillospiraceae bacterium]HPR75867.1 serine hydrolase [Oscillospiraceae bacterium]
MFEQFEEMLTQSGANVFRYYMYRDGEITSHERLASYPCSNCYSISKNFTATAVGLAYDMGLLGLDDLVVDLFKEELPKQYDENLKRVRVWNLLTQTMGLEKGCLFEPDRYSHGTDDFIQVALSQPLPNAPGTKFTYSNSTFYLLACIVEKLSGMPLDLFIRKYLFSKLGINEFTWERCPKGHVMGATGLYLSTADLLKLGILYCNNGFWEGERLLSEKWVNLATAKRPEYEGLPTALSFWFIDGGFQGSGAYRQCLIVYPERKIVFAAHSFETKIDVGRLIQDYIQEI